MFLSACVGREEVWEVYRDRNRVGMWVFADESTRAVIAQGSWQQHYSACEVRVIKPTHQSSLACLPHVS